MAVYEREALDFTDGDTSKRFSVFAADVLATSQIAVNCQRPADLSEASDAGFTYHATVVNVYAGGFDVQVDAFCLGEPASQTGDFPNELVTLNFVIY